MSKSVILKCYIIFNFIVPICEAATSLKPLSLSRSLSLTLRLRSQLSSRPLLSVASPLHNHSPSRGALAAAAAPPLPPLSLIRLLVVLLLLLLPQSPGTPPSPTRPLV
jgi:hypothetical protein